ncbi:hypothetical protein Vi05172_g13125 [Venturia inaequalis]|nr:hypothetical protein Vi05172_g13125 [Venturia inaequalis]
MHSIKSRARHASYKQDKDSVWDQINPFGRTNSRSSVQTTRELDLESGVGEVRPKAGKDTYSEGDIRTAAPHSGPPRAQTFDTSPTDTITSGGANADYYRPDNASNTPTLNGDTAKETLSKRNLGSVPEGSTKEKFSTDRESGNSGMTREDDDEKAERLKREHDERMKAPIPWVQQFRTVLAPRWLTVNWLLIAAPVGIGLHFSKVDPLVVFIVNFVAIVPLAGILSFATEEIAIRVGEVLGGLLNASFGNAVELIVGIIALAHKEIIIVQTSLIGSMLSNLLLVLGMCFFFGGVNRLEQHFNITVAQTAASILALSVGALLIPTAFTWGQGAANVETQLDEKLSYGTAIIMLLVYGAYLFFQLKSHKDMYNAPSKKVEKRKGAKKGEGDAFKAMALAGGGAAATAGGHATKGEIAYVEPDEEPEVPQLSLIGACVTLAIATALIGVCAEFLVDSINAVTCKYHVSEYFVGLILLPIVGNAAEHATAVTVAIKDKMDLAIGVAVGSSMQIALLVLPLMVILGWIIGADMTLIFDDFQIVVIFVAVILVNYLIGDGKSHWLEGVLLMALYIIIALAAWFYPKSQGGCGGE